MSDSPNYDSLLLLSFGAPEEPDHVMPFLENVVSGKRVPRERLLEVAEHYYEFGGKSPLADQNRELIEALRAAMDSAGIALPIYWGNLHWHPMLEDTVRQMAEDGRRSAMVLVTSAYGGTSSCRKYRNAIAAAREAVGSSAPELHKLRHYFNHPGFVNAMCDQLKGPLEEAGENALLMFTAHSVPVAAAGAEKYASQLLEASRTVAEQLGRESWRLVYQSRSGPPQMPWLAPDVVDAIDEEAEKGTKEIILAPIGFTSDHMEVIYDLDHEALERCEELGIRAWRAHTVGVHPVFISGLMDLIRERLNPAAPRLAVGRMPASPDECPPGCCQPPPGAPRRPGPPR